MQKLQITVSEEELRFLEGVRDTGFSSVQEVIRCAALSYLDSRADDGKGPESAHDAGPFLPSGGMSASSRTEGRHALP
jgi:hypothetical protein